MKIPVAGIALGLSLYLGWCLPLAGFAQPLAGTHAPPFHHAGATKSSSANIKDSKHPSSKSSDQSKTSEDKSSSAKDSDSSSTTNDGNSKSSEDSFKNGKMTLGKFVNKNGWHKNEPVVVVVDASSHFTYVFQLQPHNHVVEVLRASNSIGKDDTPTPFGPYRVSDKLKWPSWIPPKSIDPKQKAVQPYNKDRKNPLGVARIGLGKFGVMLHGTNDPKSLRKDVSHGCIRHSNADIMKIFNMVEKGTTVIVARKLQGLTLTEKEFETGVHAKAELHHTNSMVRHTTKAHGVHSHSKTRH